MQNTAVEHERDEIRGLRKLTGLSQFCVAKRSGICRTRVSLFENGHIKLRPDEVAAIRSVLQQAVADNLTALKRVSSADTITA